MVLSHRCSAAQLISAHLILHLAVYHFAGPFKNSSLVHVVKALAEAM
jgi:hypothetical protein